jgi:hypothetical protein
MQVTQCKSKCSVPLQEQSRCRSAATVAVRQKCRQQRRDQLENEKHGLPLIGFLIMGGFGIIAFLIIGLIVFFGLRLM